MDHVHFNSHVNSYSGDQHWETGLHPVSHLFSVVHLYMKFTEITRCSRSEGTIMTAQVNEVLGQER